MFRLSFKYSRAVIFPFFCSLFFFLYLEIAFWQCFGIFTTYLRDFLLLFTAVVCFLFAFLDGRFIVIPKKCINYLILIIGIGIIMQLINGRGVSGVTMSAISAILLAFVFYHKKISLFFLYLHIIIITVVVGYKFYLGIDPNLMFSGTSRNTISVFFMFGAIVINIEELKIKKNVTLLPSLLFVLFSIAAVGRSGLLCALLYFMGVCLYKLYHLNKRKRIQVLGLFAVTGIIIWCMYGALISEYVSNLEVFMRLSGNETSGSQRTLMNMRYVSNINFLTFFYGYDFSSDFVFQYNHLNPHNSFITLHHIYGVVGLFLLFVLMFIMIELWKSHDKFYVMSLVVILLRASSDQLMFPGEYDFFILYFVLLYSYKSTKLIKFGGPNNNLSSHNSMNVDE